MQREPLCSVENHYHRSCASFGSVSWLLGCHQSLDFTSCTFFYLKVYLLNSADKSSFFFNPSKTISRFESPPRVHCFAIGRSFCHHNVHIVACKVKTLAQDYLLYFTFVSATGMELELCSPISRVLVSVVLWGTTEGLARQSGIIEYGDLRTWVTCQY